MARTIRKAPHRRDRRTAERDFAFEAGPWFVPAEPRELRFVHRLEDNWRIRIDGREIEGRDLPDAVQGPRRRFQPDVEVHLDDDQVVPFAQMIRDLEGPGVRVSVGRIQGRWTFGTGV